MPKNINIVVDEEFRDLLPPLTDEVYQELEKSLLSEGCRDDIVLWNDVIVDGHNRYEICQRHGLPFETTSKDFASRDTAKIWIISTQFARRQLTREEMVFYRGVQYNLEKLVKGTNNQYVQQSENGQNVRFHSDEANTAQRLAGQYNVAERTIRRDGDVADAINRIGEASPDAKKKILKGKAGINKKELGKLHTASDEEISEVAGQIADGTYSQKDKQAATVAETDAEVPPPTEQIADSPADTPVPEQTVQATDEVQYDSALSLRVPEGWVMPEPIQGKKQTWCAFISAGMDALGGVIGRIEKDLRNKLPLVETQEERDFIRQNFQSHIDRQIEIIKLI